MHRTPRGLGPSFKQQASSNKLDKLQVIGYYRIMKNRKDKMTSKEIAETLDRLTDADWERMKQHMDEKFPNMKLPDMQSFKDLCRIYNMTDRFNEKKLN